jgi:outer membrane protein OmpA-like peptidoglycan-associated protein
MQSQLITLGTLAAVLAAGAGCATKGYVQEELYYTNTKVDTLSGMVEQTQERTRKNEVRIGEVDMKADQAGLWAKNAELSASTALAKAEAVELASKKLLYEVILAEDDGNFGFGKTDLPPTAMQNIDVLVEQLKTDPRGQFVEIEGHTDSVGTKAINDYVGMARAEAVKRYLHEKHGIPLHKMNVISYGKDKPIAPNHTREGRAQNRRVVIRVLA